MFPSIAWVHFESDALDLSTLDYHWRLLFLSVWNTEKTKKKTKQNGHIIESEWQNNWLPWNWILLLWSFTGCCAFLLVILDECIKNCCWIHFSVFVIALAFLSKLCLWLWTFICPPCCMAIIFQVSQLMVFHLNMLEYMNHSRLIVLKLFVNINICTHCTYKNQRESRPFSMFVRCAVLVRSFFVCRNKIHTPEKSKLIFYL